ncbi:MAG: 2-oxo acid dehydrogenase subunit E2 [Clostridia bacterium]|nr:2-oxo acid dehydrogenase subunit E2 [Clostridia bacterium]
MEKRKKRWGDRKDGRWLRDIDAMHIVNAYVQPNRADNEAFISERIDLTEINAYLAKKNAGDVRGLPYTVFHVIAAALAKTVCLRPKMNRFVQDRRVYQRDTITLSFVIKKRFNDEAEEALAFIQCDEHTTLDTLHDELVRQVTTFRSESKDNTTDMMESLKKIPRPILSFLMWILTKLDRKGKMPDFLSKTDPLYATVFISNLGSIGLKCGYHHLSNWGTNSVFVVIGEKQLMPFYDADGNVEMREALNLGLTIDERIADGYYYSKTVKLLKHLLHNPELLEQEASMEVSI